MCCPVARSGTGVARGVGRGACPCRAAGLACFSGIGVAARRAAVELGGRAAPSRGASVTGPDAAGRERGAAEAGSRDERRAASAGATGAPPFSRMTATFVSNRGGAGGGAARVTTWREATGAGGLGAAASRVVIRSEARVGITGTGPRRTGALSTVRTTARSWTTSRETDRPDTKTFWFTTVT